MERMRSFDWAAQRPSSVTLYSDQRKVRSCAQSSSGHLLETLQAMYNVIVTHRMLWSGCAPAATITSCLTDRSRK